MLRRLLRRLGKLSRVSLTLAIVAAVVAMFIGEVTVLDQFELRTYDLRFRSRGPTTTSSAIAIAMVDEKSLATEGRWPWPRAKIAALVDRLSEDGAKVIAFDIGFLEPDENSELALLGRLDRAVGEMGLASPALTAFLATSRAHADNDRALADAIERSKAAVVLGYFFHMAGRSLRVSSFRRGDRAAVPSDRLVEVPARHLSRRRVRRGGGPERVRAREQSRDAHGRRRFVRLLQRQAGQRRRGAVDAARHRRARRAVSAALDPRGLALPRQASADGEGRALRRRGPVARRPPCPDRRQRSPARRLRRSPEELPPRLDQRRAGRQRSGRDVPRQARLRRRRRHRHLRRAHHAVQPRSPGRRDSCDGHRQPHHAAASSADRAGRRSTTRSRSSRSVSLAGYGVGHLGALSGLAVREPAVRGARVRRAALVRPLRRVAERRVSAARAARASTSRRRYTNSSASSASAGRSATRSDTTWRRWSSRRC